MLLALAAALFSMYILRTPGSATAAAQVQARGVAWMTTVAAAALWLTTLVGTYVVFPPYRASPPEGTTVLTAFPRSLIFSNPETACCIRSHWATAPPAFRRGSR